MAANCRQLILILLLLGSLSDWRTLANNSRPLRNADIIDMADALKYLQDLDTYYADKARVRFGKRMPLLQAVKNRLTNMADLNRSLEGMANAGELY